MPIDQSRLVYVGSALWLAIVYYVVYEILFTVIPEFIEYWAMGMIGFIIFSALYVNGVGGNNNLIKFILATGIDFSLSFIFSDFGEFLLFVSGMII